MSLRGASGYDDFRMTYLLGVCYTVGMKEKDIARFWTKVDRGNKDECWEWKAARNWLGYGTFWVNDLKYCAGAHRVSWEIENGPIPEGMWVCHRCDNPGCVNPAHLFLGTALDDMRDKANKGRSSSLEVLGEDWGERCKRWARRGTEHHTAVLTEEMVLEMRRWHAAGWNKTQLAHAFGVQRERVRYALNDGWKHVPAVDLPDRKFCHRGHEFTDKNTRFYNGKRQCKACARVRYQLTKDKKR